MRMGYSTTILAFHICQSYILFIHHIHHICIMFFILIFKNAKSILYKVNINKKIKVFKKI